MRLNCALQKSFVRKARCNARGQLSRRTFLACAAFMPALVSHSPAAEASNDLVLRGGWMLRPADLRHLGLQ